MVGSGAVRYGSVGCCLVRLGKVWILCEFLIGSVGSGKVLLGRVGLDTVRYCMVR